MEKVSIARCEDYDYEKVRHAVENCVLHLGPIKRLFGQGQRILLKVNNIGAYPPSSGATTHPVLVEAVIDLVQTLDCIPVVCDGPMAHAKSRPFAASGIEQVCRGRGIELINFNSHETEYGTVEIKDGVKLRQVLLPTAIVEASAIINLPKLKTHEFTVFTGAVKNLFGLPPATSRRTWHRCFSHEYEFSKILVDILKAVKCKLILSIMDAVVVMEGDGPVAGDARTLGLVMASRDPVALDAISVRTLGFDPMRLSSTQIAHQLGVGCGDLRQIDMVGDSIEHLTTRHFTLPKASKIFAKSVLNKALVPFVTVRPKINPQDCIGCGACYSNCPAGAISMKNSTAIIDPNLCIKCYCCQESCIQRAVSSQGFFLKSSLLYECLRESKRYIVRSIH
jgi:uncharacterized protein (DUF362 family)/formate hydrogenlyase subunit 6/NADH:ubiquinone oxidoreductase subunit I